mgnify:CR=1 FL=1
MLRTLSNQESRALSQRADVSLFFEAILKFLDFDMKDKMDEIDKITEFGKICEFDKIDRNFILMLETFELFT